MTHSLIEQYHLPDGETHRKKLREIIAFNGSDALKTWLSDPAHTHYSKIEFKKERIEEGVNQGRSVMVYVAEPALLLAASLGRFEMIEPLIKAIPTEGLWCGQQWMSSFEIQGEAYKLALESGRSLETIKKISRGTAPDCWGPEVFWWAKSEKNTSSEVLDELLSRGCDVNALSDKGEASIIHLLKKCDTWEGVLQGLPQKTGLLLKNEKLDLQAQDHQGNNVLMRMMPSFDFKDIELIMYRSDPGHTNHVGESYADAAMGHLKLDEFKRVWDFCTNPWGRQSPHQVMNHLMEARREDDCVRWVAECYQVIEEKELLAQELKKVPIVPREDIQLKKKSL